MLGTVERVQTKVVRHPAVADPRPMREDARIGETVLLQAQ